MSAHEQRLRAMQPGESMPVAWYAGYDVRRVCRRLNAEQRKNGGTLWWKVYGGGDDARVYLCDWSLDSSIERDQEIQRMVEQLEGIEPGGYLRIAKADLHRWRLATMKANIRCGHPSRYRIAGTSIIRWERRP